MTDDNDDKLRIDRVWAFVSVDHDGNEGVCAFFSAGAWMPMIAADEARLKSLEPLAQRIADTSTAAVKLIQLSTRTELRTLKRNG